MLNKAKNRATGRIPITVKAMLFAFSHSRFPLVPTAGQAIASDTSEKMRIPMSKATAAPMKLKMNPRLRTIVIFFSLETYLRYKSARYIIQITILLDLLKIRY